MAFEGDLSELQLGDVLQTLAMTRQYGTLVVRGHEERRIGCAERGLVLLTVRPSHGERIARHLAGTGKLGQNALEEARRIARRRRGALLDDVLLEEGAVSEADLRASRRYVAQEDVFELFMWRQGRFEFLAEAHDFAGPFAEIWLDVNGIAMEAARRMDETPALDRLAPPDEVFVGTGPEHAPVAGQDSADVCAVHALADGTRSVADICAAHHFGDFDTRKILAGLHERGALRRAEAAEILAASAAVKEPERAARLLARVVGLLPDDDEPRRKLAEALERAGDRRGAAHALAELAGILHARGDGAGGLDAARSALKLDKSSPSAHSVHSRLLLASGKLEEALAAAREAVVQCLADALPQPALEIACECLEAAPADVALRRGAAAALTALGRTQEAVELLEETAEMVEAERAPVATRLEVYRALVATAPERETWQRRIDEITAAEAARRRRFVRIAAIAGCALVLAALGVPLLRGASVEERVAEAGALVSDGRYDEARAILDALSAEDVDEEQQVNIGVLRASMDRSRGPDLSATVKAEIAARLDALSAGSATAAEEKRLADALASIELALAELESPDARRLAEADAGAVAELRAELAREAQSTLSVIEERAAHLARLSTEVRDAYQTSGALRQAEFSVDEAGRAELESLVARADELVAEVDGTDWKALVETVGHVVERAKPADAAVRTRIATAASLLAENTDVVRGASARALAYVHRTRLREDFRAAKQAGADLLRDGKVELALAAYREYVAFCAEVRATDRGEEYRGIVEGIMHTLPLEDLHKEQIESLEAVLADERAANEALERGDVGAAFHLRCELVRHNPAIGFSRRFALPLRLVTHPGGAEVVQLGAQGETALGTTPTVIEYPVLGPTQLAVRLPGFEELTIARAGAFDDATAEVEVELIKRAVWVSAPGAATEARPALWQDRVFVADREGVVRALACSDGRELARHDTGLLGGFTAAPAIHGDRLHVAGVDGVAFVFACDDLHEVRRYELAGAARAPLLALDAGVVVADDHGDVRLVDDGGRTVWLRPVGTVLVEPAQCSAGIVLVTLEGELVVLAPQDGAERLRAKIPGQPRWSAPAVSGDVALVSSEAGSVSAIDLRTGAVSWSHEFGERLTGRPAPFAGGAAAGTPHGAVRLVGADGVERVASAPEAPFDDGLVPFADGLVAVGRTGLVRRIGADGALEWRFDAKDAVGARALAADRRLFLVTRAGRVILLEP